MGFRVVFIENKVHMKIKLDNIVIDNGERESWIPINDVNMIVVDNIQTTITGRTLCLLAQNNVGLIICNQEHLPIGYYSSYDNHSRISKFIGFQIQRNKEFYDKLWKDIVQSKLENQAQFLEKYEFSQDVINSIRAFKVEVVDGDITNREAHGAKIYFNEMMGESFSRGNDEILLNSGLDYGYTIIRSYIARLCVGYGLNSQLGIHHKNEYNRFNLVDDIMEPVRPIVDLFAYKLLKNEQFFKAHHRADLVNLLNHKILYKNKKMYLCNMLEDYVSDTAAFIAGKRSKIIFPEVNNYIGEENEV